MINYEVLLFEVEKVPLGVEFKVSDLFVPLLWRQVDLTQRRKLAIRFKMDVEDLMVNNVEIAGKDSSSAQLYRKIDT